MTYNVFIGYGMGNYNLLAIPKKHLEVVVGAWLDGATSFYLSGNQYHCKNFNSLQIFTNEKEMSKSELEQIKDSHGNGRGFLGHTYFEPEQLEKLGKNITDEIIGDQGYGSNKQNKTIIESKQSELYINPERINELQNINGTVEYDLSKLIVLCNEINDNYQHGNYYSVILLLRTILNHIPPAFNGKENFEQVLSELNGKRNQTRREIFSRLQELQRRLSDLVAHERLQKTEPKMVAQDVQFIPEMNFLLKEAYQELTRKKL